MPEQIIEKIKKSVLPQWKVCFITAIVFGVVTHLYKITNWLPNWDSLVFRYDGQNMIAMGRWFLPVACAPSSFYDLPLVAGLLAIILHALGAVCICKMLGVKKNVTAFLVGALVVTFPTVCSVLLYNYVADGYALAFLFSCLAAMLVTSEKPKYWLSAILIVLSAGIYQAYVTVTIMLLLFVLINETIYGKCTIKELLLKGVKMLITGGAGMALYYVLMNVILKITGTTLLEYQGLESAVSLKGIKLYASLYTAYNSFIDYFFDFSVGISTFAVINCIVFGLCAVFYATEIVRRRVNIARILLLVPLLVLLPIGASVLAFINSGIDYHNLMKMGFSVFYLFFILQYERADFTFSKINTAKAWTVLLVTSALVFNHIIIANISYHELNMAYEKSYGTLIRIADRIEQTEGASSCDSILVIGQLEGSEAYSLNLPPNMTGSTNGYIIRADDEIVGQSVLCSTLCDYCGKDYRFLAGEEKERIISDINANKMPSWPEKDSVRVKDNIIIIKLSDVR